MLKHKNNRYFIDLSLSIALALFPAIANSGNFPKTESDFAQLPPFCKARMGDKRSPAYKQWDKKLGHKNFIHIHHLCSGLHSLNTARRMDKRSNLYTRELISALGGIDYVLEYTDKNFIFYPVMLLKKAEINLLLKNPATAILDLEKAIQAKPKYSQAYAKLSDIYIKLGNISKAKEVLKIGLNHQPKSKSLKARLKRLQ